MPYAEPHDAQAFNAVTSGVPAVLFAFAEVHLGPVDQVANISWDHGESQVWRLKGSGRKAVLKAHRQGRKLRQELAAYREWMPRLSPKLPASLRTPQLIAEKLEHPRALLLGWEEGQLLEAATVAPEVERDLHRLAGIFLQALHSLATTDVDTMSLADAYLRRLAVWSHRATNVLPRKLIDNVNAYAVEAVPYVSLQSRVPCHRDFTPRNWLVDTAQGQAGALTVIDFEHSHPDLYLADLQRMWAGLWPSRPDLRESFFEGYGRSLSADDEAALRSTMAMWGLTTVVWAREHGDAELEQVGLTVLSKLGLGAE